MNRGVLLPLLIVGGLIVYFVLANVISSVFSFQGFSFQGDKEESVDTGEVKISLSDSVSVSVVRNRWYGKIYDNGSGETRSVIVYVFGKIRLPLEVNGRSLWVLHIFLLVALAFTGYAIYSRMMKRAFERGFYY